MLSRLPTASITQSTMTTNQWLEGDIIVKEVYVDEHYKEVIQRLLLDSTSHANYSLKHGALFNKGRLVITPRSMLFPTILSEFHFSPFEGHLGFFSHL